MDAYQKELEAVRQHLVSLGHVNIAELLDYYEFEPYGQPRTTYVRFKDHDGNEHKVPTDIDYYELLRTMPPIDFGDEEE